MIWSELSPDIRHLLIATASGLILGLATMIFRNRSKPAWPLRLYLTLFKSYRDIPVLRRYAERRTSTTFREQFLASWFVWFFIIFTITIFFGCNSRTC